MIRRLMQLMAALLLIPMGIYSQTYQQLWKQVDEARKKDLPKTALQHLQKIEKRARKEQAYGQLLKSVLLTSRLQAEVAPDSLRPAVARLEQQLASQTDPVLQAVYATVLCRIWRENRQLADDSESRSRQYYQQATAHPDLLAGVKAADYEPFAIRGRDSEAFGHDLLSVIGQELDAWQWLDDYYTRVGNRRARCHLALRTAGTIAEFDSLAALYADLPEAAIIAKKRQNLWAMETNPEYCVQLSRQVTEVGKPQKVELFSLRNLRSITLRVYRTRLKGDTELNPNDAKDYRQMKAGLTELKELAQTVSFAPRKPNEFFKDSLLLAGLPAGVYMLECSSEPATEVTRMLYFVSAVRVMALPMPQDKMRYVAVDALTGQPLTNAVLRLVYNMGWNVGKQTQEQACNLQGECIVDCKSRRPSAVYALTPDDAYCPSVDTYGRYNYYERKYDSEHTQLFTDRSIYRPGQTVHVAAVVWREQSATDNAAVSGKLLTMELRDANYKVVAEQEATTDRYGKCATQFTLPAGLLNGRFTVRANGQSTSFSVEEYKRPTFQVEFQDYKKSYQRGDTVRARADVRSYAGVPVQGAKVRYTVHRRVAYWWLSFSWYWQSGYMGRGLSEEQVGEGEAVTDDEGCFEVSMPMVLPDDDAGSPMFYHFTVQADVTDTAGETHSGTMTLPLGTKPTALTCDLPQQVRSDQMPKVTFTRRNAAGKEIEGTVNYRIDKGKWQHCPANSQLSTLNSQLSPGEHRLTAICGQDTIDMRFVVFGLDDKVPATPTHDWFYVSHRQFPNNGEPVTLQVGSSDPDMHIVYGIFAGGREIESGSIARSAELLNRKFTYKEEYGSGLLLTYAWVKDGECHNHTATITRPVPDKQLKLTWETFRDRLYPGQQEEWRLKILNPDGTPADASLLAVLYDKSLDAIRGHQWYFAPGTYQNRPSTGWQWRSWTPHGWSAAYALKLQNVRDFDYTRFDGSVYPYYHHAVMVRGLGKRALLAKASAPADELAESKAVIGSFDVMGNDAEADEVVTVGYGTAKNSARAEAPRQAEEQHQEDVPLRENLQETAFFYPQLATDATGGVMLKFTMPESLTTWRFMGIANTADMFFGSIDGETVARKELMVQPNMPRFVRVGDETVVTTRIANMGEKSLKGDALLRLTDTEGEGELLSLTEPFEVEAGKTVSVAFRIPADVLKPALLICKISAIGTTETLDGFSDGEQHYLPVLPDCEYVTKTVPLTLHEPGVRNIELTQLFPQGTTQQRLTVEYTGNPAWLMVQALPTLGQPQEHSAIDQAASYYSNMLAKTLLAQNPQVRNVFEQWKRETAPQTSLHSQLEKNSELKDLVLAETPWVDDADRETEQRQRLADFFDENGIANRLSAVIEKLQKLQNADGSFSWYPGMQGSTMITVAVEEMLVRLDKMAGRQDDIRKLQDRAFNFIGKEMTDLVAELKKQEKKGHRPVFPSFTALRWLYLCALDGRVLPANVKTANDYLIALLKKDIKRQTIYEKALTAVVLSKHGEGRKAREYVQSLKEYTVYTEDMGRYYDTGRAGYSWYDYKIPTEVAAIEAIMSITPDDGKTVDEMRRWLLQEKRTQAWDTPVNSVNAIWAFLVSGSALQQSASHPRLAVDGTSIASARFAVDGSPIDTPPATAALGYVKTTLPNPTGRVLTVTKTGEGTSWGAVYAQFLQKTASVEAAQSGITVKRELTGPRQQSAWRVGDRIKVRITIEASRDFDFVQVADRRAACMEPVRQLSGYHQGAYVSPKDASTNYFYYQLSKGRHVIETEYYIDRVGLYETGTCSVQCAYSPEFRATAPSIEIKVNE